MKKLLLSFSALSMMYAVNAQTHFSEDFNGGTLTGWTATDVDGDGENWYNSDFSGYFAELGAGTAVSRSWTGTAGALTPNNYLVSGAIDLSTAAASGLTLLFKSGTIEPSPYEAEHYAVYVSTSNDPTVIAGLTPVFEETLPSDGMFSHSVDLSSYAGQTVYIAFRHFNTNDMNTMLIDDVVVKNLLPDDAALASVDLVRYAATSTNSPLSMEVTNAGSNTITSITADWNDGAAHSQTIAVNIAPGATQTVQHPDFVTYATATEASIAVDITAVNGNADSDATNNTGATLHNTVSQIATKKVVIEEGTGTWCGWCPRGAVAMDYMTSTYANFIGIAVHNGDPMTVTAYDNGANFSGFPGSNVDRVMLDQSVSQNLFESYYNQRKDLVPPAGVSVTVGGSGSAVSLDVSATFYTPFANANYRLAVVMVEDNVTGTTSGYNQTNYYAGGSNGAMGGYESLPDPVPAAQMVYNHVGRALVGGYSGQAGSVPATITDGQVVNYTFNYTVPSTMNKGNMHAVVMIIDQTNGEIVNAEEVEISLANLAEVEVMELNVFPNPTEDKINVAFEANNQEYTVTVTDLQGRVVVSENYGVLSGAQSLALDLTNVIAGNYLVSVSTNGASYTEMISVK